MKLRSYTEEEKLIDQYEVGDFFLASPNRTILGKGILDTIKNSERSDHFPIHVQNVLNNVKQNSGGNPIAVGAIPFDTRKSVELIIPNSTIIHHGPYMDHSREMISNEASYEIQSIPEASEYMNGVSNGITKIISGKLNKIVLGRVLDITSCKDVEVSPILHNLKKHNKSGYTFAVNIGDFTSDLKGSRKTLIGASPELLVSKIGNKLVANPLAGSRPRSKDSAEDQRRAQELATSHKDLIEHEVVVEAVRNSLQPFCHSLVVPEKPSIIKTETMWHLSTEIYGEVNDPSISSLTLAYALHPTPAVCGSPTELAREEIYQIEPFDRGFFTGMVGWCSQSGDGEWVVTIRCAEIEAQKVRLFAGAGIVADSKPEEELAETAAKFKTMLDAMGLGREIMD